MTETRTWTATAADRTYSGRADSVAAAWTNATTAALQLAHDTGGSATLQLSVDGEGEPADVLPACTEHGTLDEDATRAMLTVLVEVVTAPLDPAMEIPLEQPTR